MVNYDEAYDTWNKNEPTEPGEYEFLLEDQGGEPFIVQAEIHEDMTVTVPSLQIDKWPLTKFWNLSRHKRMD